MGESLTDALDPFLHPGPDPAAALTFAVTGGCGGAGASVLAAVLARTAAPLTPTVLIDCDLLGGGADLLLGAEDEPGTRWPQLALARGRLAPGSLLPVLPLIDGVRVVTGDRELAPNDPSADPSADTVAAVVDAARREAGIIVLDLPRGADPRFSPAMRAADVVLCVVPADLRSTAAARRALVGLRACCADVRLVVRTRGSHDIPPGLVASALDLPLSGVLRPEPGLDHALRRGEPPGLRQRSPLARLCRELVAELVAELMGEPVAMGDGGWHP